MTTRIEGLRRSAVPAVNAKWLQFTDRLQLPPRWRRPIQLGLGVAGVGWFLFLLSTVLTTAPYNSLIGVDRGIYQRTTLDWLHGSPWYSLDQIAGPYNILVGHVLYPPIALLLLVPGVFLPDALWWGIPLVVTAAVMWHHRPKAWAWLGILACLGYWWSVMLIASGNPSLWIMMCAALGTIWRPAFALVAFKPSLFPLMVPGARSRGYWLILGSLALLSIVMLPMWIDYAHVLLNARGPWANIWYSTRDAPLVFSPLVAWLGRGRKEPAPAEAEAGSMPGAGIATSVRASRARP